MARGEPALQDVKAEVEELGGQALVVPVDVADHDAVEEAAERVERELGPIDVWVNDAMATVFAKVIDTEPHEFRRATEVTYLGTVNGTMAALKRMTARDRGVIIQVGSALSYRAIPLQAAYCGAKFGIRGFTDSLRVELRADKSHVRVTMVQLPGVNTTQFNWCRSKMPDHPQPVPPIYQPEIPAEAVYWAAHHRRRELWVGYSAVQAIVGGALAPSFADWYLARTGIQRAADLGPSGRPRPSGQPVRTPAAARRHPRHVRRQGQESQPGAVDRDPSADAGRRRRGGSARRGRRRRGAALLVVTTATPEHLGMPHILREYALLADGERGIIVGPHGDYQWMCFPHGTPTPASPR